MAKSSVIKAHLKAVTVLVDRQLYGSEFQTEGELRRNDFADIVRDRVDPPEKFDPSSHAFQDHSRSSELTRIDPPPMTS